MKNYPLKACSNKRNQQRCLTGAELKQPHCEAESSSQHFPKPTEPFTICNWQKFLTKHNLTKHGSVFSKSTAHLEARGMDWETEPKGAEVVVVGLRLRYFWVTILDLDTKFLEPLISADLQSDAISGTKESQGETMKMDDDSVNT